MTARGLFRHSPASAQIAHWVELLSEHFMFSHTPHELGHSLYMKPGFCEETKVGVRRRAGGDRRAAGRGQVLARIGGARTL